MFQAKKKMSQSNKSPFIPSDVLDQPQMAELRQKHLTIAKADEGGMGEV